MNHISEIAARPIDFDPPPWRRRRRRYGWVVALGGLALLVAAAVATWYFALGAEDRITPRRVSPVAPAAAPAQEPVAAMLTALAPGQPGAGGRGSALIHAIARAELLGVDLDGLDRNQALARASKAMFDDPAADRAMVADSGALALSLTTGAVARADLGLALAVDAQRHGADQTHLFTLWGQIAQDLQAPQTRAREIDFAALLASERDRTGTDAALRIIAGIGEADLRVTGFNRLGRSALASHGVGAVPDAALLAAAGRMAEAGRFHAATLVAMAATPAAGKARDEALFAVARALVLRREVADGLYPLLAIRDPLLRDRYLLAYVSAATSRRMTRDAGLARAAIGGRRAQALATAILAEGVGGRGFARQARQILVGLPVAIDAMPADATREAAAAHAVGAYAAIGDLDEAGQLFGLIETPSPRRSAAALALAKGMAAAGREPGDIAELAQFGEGSSEGEILGIAAVRAARVDVEDGTAIVGEARSPAARARAAARLAVTAALPPEWLEAERVNASGLGSAGLFDLAMIETAQNGYGPAAGRIGSIADVDLKRDLVDAIARGFVATDRTAAALALVARLDPADKAGRDGLYATVAEALMDRGALRPATRVARAMADPIRRVRAFRHLAVAQAGLLDRERRLRGSAGEPRPRHSAPTQLDPLIRRASYSVLPLDDGHIGDRLPRLPDALRYTASDVAGAVPAITGGRVEVPPLANNGLNKKFLTKRSLFADQQIGSPSVVMAAQGTRYPVYIHVSSGVVDLPGLRDQLVIQGHGDLLKRQGRNYVLRAPLLIGAGATLVLSDADVGALRLSLERAAYLVNAGSIYMKGIDLVGWSEARGAPAHAEFDTAQTFRPFFTAWSNSRTYAAETHFLSLGYAAGKAYGFSLSAGPAALTEDVRELAEPTGIVVDNSFENMLYGFYSYEARSVAVVGNEYRDNIVYGIDPHDRSHGLLFAFNSAYGSHKKHGIIGSRHVEDSWFLGNLSFANTGSGLMMDRYTGRNIIYANTAFDNLADGIAIYESPCNIVSGNHVLDNRRAGVKVRNSWNVGVHNNVIRGNGGNGIEGYALDLRDSAGHARDLLTDPYERALTMSVAGNTVANNRGGGVSAASMGTVAMRDNQLVGNPSKLYQGELGPAEQDIVRLQRAGLMVGGGCPLPKRVYQCPFLAPGYLSAELAAAMPTRGMRCSMPGRDAAAIASPDDVDDSGLPAVSGGLGE